ncbi:hypothetical protein CROQUDRAFT_670305 [Cronartium quercuum f. sp. fusiforme G11]|uniref:Protein transport protein sec16 n=1 Tax=Cronartium quercuum f. sp. fusiforme G11 TaxID=708437 RepID=A0A9P6NP98_9BASI|nr:hypothetical protein CROQUDRAFT_670305 [Cronartium quercuum f. sp. fusiforme G11]
MSTDLSPLTLDAPPAQVADSGTTPTGRTHQSRKPSVGDASQLFGGGGSGLDDFFGSSSFSNHPSQPPGFATLREEFDPSAANAQFSWSTDQTPQSTPNGPSDDFYSIQGAGVSPISQDPYTFPSQAPSASHRHSYPITSNTSQAYSPNLSQSSTEPFRHFSPASYVSESSVSQVAPTYADYPQYDAYPDQHYAQDPNFLTQTGLGISNAPPPQPGHHPQTSYPDYNPYGLSQSFNTSNSCPSVPSHQGPSANPYDPVPNVPRTGSVGYQPVPGLPDTNQPALSHSHIHQSSQPALTHQSSAVTLTRPKALDAYDPPPIRKKKQIPPSAAASLPSSPALGYGQANQFGFGSFPSPPPAQTPPPPPKKRSISGPAEAPVAPGSNFYQPELASAYTPDSPQPSMYEPSYQPADGPQQAQTLHAPNLEWSSPSPNTDPQPIGDSPYEPQKYSNGTGRQSQSFHPYNPNPCFPPPTTFHHNGSSYFSQHAVSTTAQNDDPYAVADHNGVSYQAMTHPNDPNASNNATQPQSRRSSYGVLPHINGRESPLSDQTRSATSSPPIGPYQFEPISASTSPKLGHAPPSPTGVNSIATSFDRKPKRSSPLKMAVSVDEESDNTLTLTNHLAGDSQPPNPDGVVSTASQSVDDLLVEATKSLTLTTATEPHVNETTYNSESGAGTTDVGKLNLIPDPSHSSGWVAPDPPSSSNNFMAVPAVLIQPATPEMLVTEVSEPSPTTTNFDILADLDQARPSEDLSQDPSPYGYAPANGTTQESDPYDYGSGYGYHQTFNSTPGEPQQPFDSYQPQSTPEFSHPSTFSDSYAPQAGSHSDSYGQSVTSTPRYHGQQAPGGEHNVYDPYSAHSYQPTGTEPYEKTVVDTPAQPSRPSSRMLASDNAHLASPSELDAYAPHSHHQSARVSSDRDRDGDPMLQRLKSRIALASFGFGGKLLTVFPSGSQSSSFESGGYEDPYGSAASASSGTTVHIHKLSEVIPFADLQAFPGPLFMEGGSKSSIGKKRKEILQWLETKIDESEKECTYIQSNGHVSKTAHQDPAVVEAHTLKVDQAQDKLLILKLLKILIENEGKLSGSPKTDEAVRNALQSILIRSPSESTGSSSHPIDSLITTDPTAPSASPDTVASYTVRASSLDALQNFFSHGDRPKALKFALDQQMWAHALVIANSLGNETWRDTVREFVRSELSNAVGPGGQPSSGRESLRTLYSLFAGAGASAMEEFIPPTLLSGPTFTPSAPSLAPSPYAPINGLSSAVNSRASSPVPISKPEPRHPGVKVPTDVLKQWRATVSLTIANRVPGTAAFLLSLGDTLLSNDRIYAAHACYLLSNGLMPIVSLENGARICLLGSDPRPSRVGPGLDVEAVMLTEVLEFALSLAVVNKGQEAFMGIPHLQPYKLAMGYEYATAGLVTISYKYCEAIGATLKLATKPGTFYPPTLIEQVKAFSGRLSAAPVPSDKNTSWIARKMPRPTLDNVWQSLEGRVHKFVAGDDDEGKPESGAAGNSIGVGGAVLNVPSANALGPFSHYSSISPASSSGSLSRAQSSCDLRFGNTQTSGYPAASGGPFGHGTLVQRPASGGGFSSTATTDDKDPRQRSTSAMVSGYNSAGWYSHAEQNLNPASPTQPLLMDNQLIQRSEQQTTLTSSSAIAATGSGSGGWWDAASGGSTPINDSPSATFTSFEGGSTSEDTSGFIDPMASFGVPTFSTGASTADFTTYRNQDSFKDDDNDDDDLGLGNNTNRRKARASEDGEEDSGEKRTGGGVETTPKTTGTGLKPEDKTVKPSPSSSWLGRWFKRDGTQPTGSGPVKANLGEEVSLVYDPETKRWVSRKPGAAPSSAAPSSTPPPPARAQTASPTSAMRSPQGVPPPPSSVNSHAPPPPISRSMSSNVPSTNGAGKSENRLSQPTLLRNSISAADLGGSAELLPAPNMLSSAGPSPPPGKKPGTKKNIRSRYVEIR